MEKETGLNEDSSKKKGRYYVEEEFALEVGCSGVSYWVKSKHVLQRIFWVLCVLAMTGAMVQQVTTRVITYFEYESTTSVSRQFISTIAFPAVTICNNNRLFSSTSTAEKTAMRALNKVTNAKQLAFARFANLSVDLESLNFFSNISNFTVSSFYEQRGMQMVDQTVLLSCFFGPMPCNAANFTPVLTSKGKCYTFNADRNTLLNQTSGGLGNGLVVILNAQHWEYTEEPLYGNQEAGIMFQVHDQYETPWVDKYGVSVPIGSKGYGILERKDFEVMYKPWGQCDPENQKSLIYFSNYSLTTCMLECYTAQVIKECGCRTFEQYWAKNFAPECSINQHYNCSSPVMSRILREYSPDICNCTLPCSFSEFPIRMSYSYVPMKETKEFYVNTYQLPENFINENILSLDVSFEEIGYSKEVQSKKVDETGLLSDVGGQLGLWVGMSFVTLVEFLQYFVVRIVTFFKKPAKKSRSKSEKDPTALSTRPAWALTLTTGSVQRGPQQEGPALLDNYTI